MRAGSSWVEDRVSIRLDVASEICGVSDGFLKIGWQLSAGCQGNCGLKMLDRRSVATSADAFDASVTWRRD